MSQLTAEAKAKLSSTIRSLRDRLLTDLHNAVESTYRLSLPIVKAGLAEEQKIKRQRLEQWLDEQVRSEVKGKKPDERGIRERHLRTAQKLAGATLLNRLVAIKQMEALGLIRPMIVTGGWQSKGYREFRDFAPDLCRDETEGFGTLLQLLYDELSLEMPGLFGRVRLSSLFPVPASTLRVVIEALNDPLLQDAWLDDTTLGWVYQYWNDPEREALDAKLNAGGKVEPHEVASKTQMFTERYMVEWLLHNSLGQMWLAICKAQGWTAEVQADGTLDRLEERRKVWREKREKGEVALDELMPIETEAEERWKYWVSQPLTEAAIAHAPKSIREVKILDPACGSGHFLVIAFGLLFALYQEEARHRGEDWSDQEIVESILTNNLFGVDIDARAVQIAAAALFLKAKSLCAKAELKAVNLVASDLNLSALPEDDPALAELRREVREATGIPEELTNQIVQALKGADQWGSLLKIDREVEKAIAQYEHSLIRPVQTDLFAELPQPTSDSQMSISDAPNRKDILLEKLETFLARCTRGDDLGLRLRGEQLTAGIRFIRLIRENSYHVVIGNPPYQGASKMDDAKYLVKHYPKSKADLYATFLERGLQLAKEGGISAMLTMRNWMFIQQYTPIREYLLDTFDLRLLGDVDRGAFEETLDEVVATVMSVFQKLPSSGETSIALQPTPLDDNSRDRYRTNRKRAAVLTQVGRFEFESDRFTAIKEKPIVYWWNDEFIKHYAEIPKLGDESDVKQGLATANNTRFLRQAWEIHHNDTFICSIHSALVKLPQAKWVPYIKGAEGRVWYEPLSDIVRWEPNALEIKLFERDGKQASRPQNEQYYFCPGAAYSTLGASFSARNHRYRSVFGDMGQSVFPKQLDNTTCLMNTKLAKDVLTALNPTIHFLVGDVKRLPLFPIESADEIFAQLDRAFTEHEAARETSVEFKQPGVSCWQYAQQWAQQAVDREPGKPLPDWNPVYDQPPAMNWVSYAIGVALGRFGANGEGILTHATESALPNGILYLSAYAGDRPGSKDSLNHPAAQPIKDAWSEYGSQIAKNKPLRDWLRLNFFKDVHIGMYEQRPIYFSLSSKNRNFVAYISIHRWADNTLQTLLADYLIPELRELEGETADLLESQGKGDRKQQAQAEERRATVQALYNELQAFIDLVQQCAEQGPPAANPKDTPRQADAPFRMDLDDGVMVNSAALWCLLEPQWNKPKTWWSELCNAKGKKDYDWSHLAARYFPKRVDEKCQKDPSLAVAHGCFWKYHPAKAYEWELRLQDEIAPDFTINEENSDALRSQFETEFSQLVAELHKTEEKRRDRKHKKDNSEQELPLFKANQFESDLEDME
ncbi:BREX-6 system adenine-specific DNA-methyltransferase PglX [Geitlerinema splendidum]|nr:BREX-6 system adenine-specific DNA-methyltransferase PglX [Geitlerinema splendidum]